MRHIPVLALGACAALTFCVLSACAVGRGPDGSAVIGFSTAALPETGGEAIAAIGGLLPPPWGQLAAIGGALLGGGVLGQRRGERAGWDEAESARRATERDRALAALPPDTAARVIQPVISGVGV